jgi:hypothetical protein
VNTVETAPNGQCRFDESLRRYGAESFAPRFWETLPDATCCCISSYQLVQKFQAWNREEGRPNPSQPVNGGPQPLKLHWNTGY